MRFYPGGMKSVTHDRYSPIPIFFDNKIKYEGVENEFTY